MCFSLTALHAQALTERQANKSNVWHQRERNTQALKVIFPTNKSFPLPTSPRNRCAGQKIMLSPTECAAMARFRDNFTVNNWQLRFPWVETGEGSISSLPCQTTSVMDNFHESTAKKASLAREICISFIRTRGSSCPQTGNLFPCKPFGDVHPKEPCLDTIPNSHQKDQHLNSSPTDKQHPNEQLLPSLHVFHRLWKQTGICGTNPPLFWGVFWRSRRNFLSFFVFVEKLSIT